MSCKGPTGNSGAPGPQGPASPTVPPPLPPTPIQVAIGEFNDQRVAVGQDPATLGLSCSLYTVPNTTTAIIGAALTGVGSWTYNGVFDDPNVSSSPGLLVLPSAIRSLYTAYYIVKCTGLFVAGASGFYSFDLSSDDGANLYVNGLLINNDGVHGITTKSATRFINRGVVSFELDFFDAGGNHALMLYSGGAPVPVENFYH